MMRKEEKTAIIEQYATHAGDTGSPVNEQRAAEDDAVVEDAADKAAE